MKVLLIGYFKTSLYFLSVTTKESTLFRFKSSAIESKWVITSKAPKKFLLLSKIGVLAFNVRLNKPTLIEVETFWFLKVLFKSFLKSILSPFLSVQERYLLLPSLSTIWNHTFLYFEFSLISALICV